MIYIYMGCLLVLMSLISFLMRYQKPGFLFGYRSYFSKMNDKFEQKAQTIYRRTCLIVGSIQIVLGSVIKWLNWDHYFLIWLLTFYLSIIFVYAITETRLRKLLVKNGIVSKEEIKKYDNTHQTKEKVKGFKDL
ncbi:hypothetical protein R4Y45_03355 [Holzapfeliella sp. He02]|uniref:SdpI family protein n=1 Tax=Holzapfeliella saturejae TaxID=3082953 RepID=A0ABU8SFW0_9LACO